LSYRKLGLENVRCYYVRSQSAKLTEAERSAFMEGLRIWDKKAFLALSEKADPIPSLEKYLLVRYAMEHLEVPPLNIRM
jgi:hypothetical protein